VVSLGVWDTAGAERFESLSRMCVPTSCTVPPASPCYTALVKACTVLPSCPRNQATLQQLVWLLPGSSTGSPAAAARRYYNGARAAIVCFNPADRLSFEKAKFWVRELRDTQVRPRPAWRAGRPVQAGAGGVKRRRAPAQPECRVYLAMTKCDLLEDPPALGLPDAAASGSDDSAGAQRGLAAPVL